MNKDTKEHKPGCKINMQCMVIHPDGVCPGPYGKCTCTEHPEKEVVKESTQPEEEACEHKNRAYSSTGVTLTVNPPINISYWICKDCGYEGHDSKQFLDEYQNIKMIMNNFFEVGKNKISYLGDNFKDWFGGVGIKIPKKAELYSKVLEKIMTDEQILEKLKPVELTLGEVAYAIKTILKKEDWGIFYVRDKDNILRVVGVCWHGDGWSAGAASVGSLGRWDDGDRVFSRNPFEPMNLSSSDTLSLENRIKSLEEDMKKIKKFLII